MYVFHQPIKYINITMNAYINIIGTLGIWKIFLKIFHVWHQQLFITPEIFVHFFVFITDMYYYICSWYLSSSILW